MDISEQAEPIMYIGLALPCLALYMDSTLKYWWAFAAAGLAVYAFRNNFINKKNVRRASAQPMGPQEAFNTGPDWKVGDDKVPRRVQRPPTDGYSPPDFGLGEER